jgi:hypothetical protein
VSSCLQASVQGVPAAQCRSVNGGEKLDLGGGVTVRVVRWNHSDDAANPIPLFARELYRPPVPDPATGGRRAGVGEDYPNGGGNGAFLFTVKRGGENLSFFVNNLAGASDLDKDIVLDGVNYGSPIGNLAAAMKDAGLTQADAWAGKVGTPVTEMVVPVIRPKAYISNHWDGLFNPFWTDMPDRNKDSDLQAHLQAQKVDPLPQTQYFDKYILTKQGVQLVANLEVKPKLGFAQEQKCSRAVLDEVDLVYSNVLDDDCVEGFAPPWPWADSFARLQGATSAPLARYKH